MSRSVEMGRAVLSAPTTNHELWLTTLITISLEQDATYLAQLKPAQFLQAFSSGAFWVGRGHDMHMDLKLTLQDETLPLKQLQDLRDAILRAPIWHQLTLRPTLPANDRMESGTVRLNISHATSPENATQQKRHRLFSGVPAADIRPPDGVVSCGFRSVSLVMDILETSPRRGPKVKQPTTSTTDEQPFRSEIEDTVTHLFDADPADEALHHGRIDSNAIAASRKRKRPTVDTTSTSLEPLYRTLDSKVRRNRVLPKSFLENGSLPNGCSPVDLQRMVDLALRLSIRGTLSKCPNGLKVKASTFRSGLADIAPALWRCGYLDALSHRTQLTPTIASSLTQLGFVRGTSTSLKVKMESLGTATYGSRSGSSHQPGRIGQRDVALLKSSVASQLWIHSQRALLGNPAPLIQTCVVSDPHFVYTKPEDMLAEVDNRPSHAVYETWDKGLALNNASNTLDEGSMLHPALRDAEEELLFDPVPYKAISAIDSYGDGKPVSSYFRTGLSTSDIFDIQPPAPFRVRETQRVCEISHPAELAPTVYPSTVKDSSTALHEECLFAEYEKHVPNT